MDSEENTFRMLPGGSSCDILVKTVSAVLYYVTSSLKAFKKLLRVRRDSVSLAVALQFVIGGGQGS